MRARSFLQAFMDCNQEWLLQLSAQVRAALRPYPASFLSKNGADLITDCFTDVTFNYVMLQVLRPETRRDPKHFDGGASLLHMALTIFGQRNVECWLADETSQVFKQVPGSIYVGTMAAIEHQVEHNSAWSGLHGGPRGFQIALQLRCDVFRHSRARQSNRKPTPSEVFDIANEIVAKHLAGHRLLIPELFQCVAATAAETPAPKRQRVVEAPAASPPSAQSPEDPR